MEEKIKMYEKIIDLAQELNINLKTEKNYFYAYMCLLDNIKFGKETRKFTDKEIAEIVSRAVDIFLDTTEDYICSIDEIIEYLVENYDDIDYDTSNYDILEDILC